MDHIPSYDNLNDLVESFEEIEDEEEMELEPNAMLDVGGPRFAMNLDDYLMLFARRGLERLRRQTRTATHEGLLEQLFPEEESRKCNSVYDVLSATPRSWFVPQRLQERAFYDMPLDITEINSNLSASHMYPKLLNLLDIQKGEHVLDIGCGSGYLCVCIAALTGSEGKVTGWDVTSDITNYAKKCLREIPADYGNLEALECVEYITHNAFFPIIASGRQRYDKIHVGAAATRRNKHLLFRYLKIGGKLIAPIEDGLFVVRRTGEDTYEEQFAMGVRYRSLLPPAKLEPWKPYRHNQFPPEIRHQMLTVLSIWTVREDSEIGSLPKEIIFHIFSFLHKNDYHKIVEEFSDSDDSDESSSEE